jgi:hypothetical protein
MNQTRMNVKFTGSAFEFPDDAVTALMYLVTLLLMLAWVNEAPRA